MSIQTNFNASPYYDDYSDVKDFLRILFRPGLAVQARELTQLQTILQQQTDRLGTHIFQDGSPVIGAEILLDTKVEALRLESRFGGTAINVHNFADQTIENTSTGAKARVIDIDEQSVYDPITLYIHHENDIGFDDGVTITTADGIYRANTVSVNGVSGLSNALTPASAVSITDGIFFVSGFFVKIPFQRIILSKYSNTPTYSVGLSIVEQIVSSIDDSSLLDNAQGAYNYSAPGANRFKINLVLVKRLLEGTTFAEQVSQEKYIELLRVQDGKKLSTIQYPLYSDLEKTLSRRTYDESGDYTVKPFNIQLNEHSTNASLISVGLDPGKAYIRGHEFETISTTYLDIEKSRSTQSNVFTLSSDYGNKVYINNVKGLFDISRHEIVDLHCVPSSKISSTIYTEYLSTKIGTARVRGFDFETADLNSSNTTHYHSIYSAHIYDTRISSIINGNVEQASDNLYIYLPTDKTSHVAGAYVGATLKIRTTYNNTTTTDTVEITGYTTTGDLHVAKANTFLSQNVLSNSTFELSFSKDMINAFTIIHEDETQTTPATTTDMVITTSADIHSLSKYNQDYANKTFIVDTNRNTLLYTLPTSPIKTLPDGLTYAFKRIQKITSDADGVFQFTCDADGVFMPLNGTISSSQAKENFTVTVFNATTVTDANGRPVSNGQIINFDTGTGRTVTIDNDRVIIDTQTTGSYVAEISYTVKVTSNARTKTLVAANTTYSTTETNVSLGQVHIQEPNKIQGNKDNLMISDVYKLVAVVDSLSREADVSTLMMTEALADPLNAHNITHHYTLDNGQKDNYYDHASIILKNGYSSPTGRILILVDYFTSTGGGYFSVDSYPINAPYNQGQDIFSYTSIPSYKTQLTNENISLRDVIDFRPVRENANNAKGANTVNNITFETGAFSFLQLGASGSTPDVEYNLVANVEYYVDRIDKVVLTDDKKFKQIKGIASLNAIAPSDVDHAMTLYTLTIPAYTFSVQDIGVQYKENKRYTMRDIGKLENRIDRLEYYTTLSLLERETIDRTITADSSVDSLFNPIGSRFKNGILVDSFLGHSIGNVENEDYNVSIDTTTRTLRPSFSSDNFNFDADLTQTTNVTINNDIATLNYTTNTTISQPLYNSSTRINPANFRDYLGFIKLYPASDTWYDNSVRPIIITNKDGQNDNWRYGANTGHGSLWNDWSKHWLGYPASQDSNITLATRNLLLQGTNFNSTVRTGIRTEQIPDSITSVIGNKIVDLSIIHYMREQTIHFVAKGLLPSTNAYIYFDQTEVTANTTESTRLNVNTILAKGANGSFLEGEIIKQGSNTALVIVSDTTSSSNDSTIQIKILTATGSSNTLPFSSGLIVGATSGVQGTISARTDYTQGQQIVTDSLGEYSGFFTIPGGKYRSGSKVIRITNSNTYNSADTTMLAEEMYHAQGLLNVVDSYTPSTRATTNRRESVSSDQIVNDITTRQSQFSSWYNPLSQTFFVDESENPNGIFLDSIDLCFKAKTTKNNLPVTVQLRPVVNGFPSGSSIIPMSEVSLRAEDIVVSDIPLLDSTTSTRVKFSSPIYLRPNEYAICLLTNEYDYELHSAILGDFVTNTTRRVNKQPNIGTLYIPQNTGAWSKDNTQNLVVKLNQCVFSTSGQLVAKSKAISNSKATSNVVFDTAKITIPSLSFYDTSMDYSYKTTNLGTSTPGTNVSLNLESGLVFDQRKHMIANTEGSVVVTTTMTTVDKNVSPVIDMQRFNITTIKNNIDNGGLKLENFYVVDPGTGYNASSYAVVSGSTISNNASITLNIDSSGSVLGVNLVEPGSHYYDTPSVQIIGGGENAKIEVNNELSSKGGNITTKYITRKVILEDGFDAADIKVILNAYKPKGSEISVYIKVLSQTDSSTFDDRPYILMQQETNSSIFSLNSMDYKEYTYKTITNSTQYLDDFGVAQNTFKTFAIKICLTSSNTIDVPKITDMRAIALDV